MKSTFLTVGLALLSLGMIVLPAFAKAKPQNHPHAGTFVSAVDGKLVMTGHSGKEHTHPLAKSVTVTVEGKPGAVTALKKGMHVSFTTDKSGAVTAITTMATPATTTKATTAITKAVTPATKPAAPAAKPASTLAKPVTATK